MTDYKKTGLKLSDFLPSQQSFVNILYLLLAFPLGIGYFIFLVTGISLGIGLLVTVVGIFILGGVFYAIMGLNATERYLAEKMLKVEIKSVKREFKGKGLWAQFKFHLSNGDNWKGLLHLFLKFPIGIASFVVVVTLYSLAISLILVPTQLFFWDLSSALIVQIISNFIMGVGLLIAAFQITDALAYGLGKMAKALLSSTVEPVNDKMIDDQKQQKDSHEVKRTLLASKKGAGMIK